MKALPPFSNRRLRRPMWGGIVVNTHPLVAVSLAGSYTGRIWHPEQPILGGSRDRYRLEWLRSQADLILYGAGTARTDKRRIRLTYPDLAAAYAQRGRGTIPPIAVVAGRADFDWTSPFWQTPTRMTLVLPDAADDGRIPDSINVLRLPATDDVALVLDRLTGGGHERVLCEGGGKLYASMARQGLVDELFYTVTPWSLGGDTPAVAPDPLPLQRFTLVSAEVADDDLLLRYRTPSGRSWPLWD